MADDEKYKVRALTRGELKRLRKEGVNIATLDENDDGACEIAIDAVIDLMFKDQVADLDNEPYPLILGLFHNVVEATYTTPGQAKNSSAPGTGTKRVARKGATGAGRKRAKHVKKGR